VERGEKGGLEKENEWDRASPVTLRLKNRGDPDFFSAKNPCDLGQDAGAILDFDPNVKAAD
jgi:hypothetical protein